LNEPHRWNAVSGLSRCQSSVYFHTFLDLDHLKRTVEGIEALGYKFVSPASL
jgi:hypothetical protein